MPPKVLDEPIDNEPEVDEKFWFCENDQVKNVVADKECKDCGAERGDAGAAAKK